MQKTANREEINSADGTASQSPLIPRRTGRKRIARISAIKVLRKEMDAEIRPFDNAVNSADAKILIPANKKFQMKIR